MSPRLIAGRRGAGWSCGGGNDEVSVRGGVELWWRKALWLVYMGK